MIARHIVQSRETEARLTTPPINSIGDARSLPPSLARIIHERFCCNRGFAAATNLEAVGMASRQAGSPFGRSTYCFKYASLPRGSARLSRVATARFRDEPS
jgi:hypothetical protein